MAKRKQQSSSTTSAAKRAATATTSARSAAQPNDEGTASASSASEAATGGAGENKGIDAGRSRDRSQGSEGPQAGFSYHITRPDVEIDNLLNKAMDIFNDTSDPVCEGLQRFFDWLTGASDELPIDTDE